VPLFDAGEDGFLEDVEHAESGDPVKLEGRTGTNTFFPGFRVAGHLGGVIERLGIIGERRRHRR
jgi:hypothetical protein